MTPTESMSPICVLHDLDITPDKQIVSKWIDQMESLKVVRMGTNQPEHRQFAILQKLFSHTETFHFEKAVPNCLTVQTLIANNIHGKAYLNFLQESHQTFIQNDDIHFSDSELGSALIPVNIARNKQTDPINSPTYKQISHFANDNMTPIYSNTFEMAMSAANICYQAHNYSQMYDVVYCSTVLPGHHAGFSEFAGYCFLNNAAVVQGNKIAILDLDYHCGDGFHSISSKMKNDRLHVSVHADTTKEYPFELTNNYQSSVNLVFPKQAKWKDYLPVLQLGVQKIVNYNPTLVVIAFGADTFQDDPDTNASWGCSLIEEDYFTMGFTIANQIRTKIVVTNEGGYSTQVDDCVFNFLLGLQAGLAK